MVEEIPGEDVVSRLVDSPHKWTVAERRFVDTALFEFPSPDFFESLVWRRYAPHINDVHALGCEMQSKKRETKPQWTYEGAVSTEVSAIRGIVNKAGDTFFVEHVPAEGLHHVHVGYVMAHGTADLKKRRLDLKEFLRNVFLASGLERHACP